MLSEVLFGTRRRTTKELLEEAFSFADAVVESTRIIGDDAIRKNIAERFNKIGATINKELEEDQIRRRTQSNDRAYRAELRKKACDFANTEAKKFYESFGVKMTVIQWDAIYTKKLNELIEEAFGKVKKEFNTTSVSGNAEGTAQNATTPYKASGVEKTAAFDQF
jgi:hypothetical protein